jgi:hypothetical protein
MEARRWVAEAVFPPDRPLINVSQAAPVEPPPEALARHRRGVMNDPGAHLYGPVLGLPELRAELAARWSAEYGGRSRPRRWRSPRAATRPSARPWRRSPGRGDEVLLPTPGISITRCGSTWRASGRCPCPRGRGSSRSGGGGRARHRAHAGGGARLAQQSGRGGISGRNWSPPSATSRAPPPRADPRRDLPRLRRAHRRAA